MIDKVSVIIPTYNHGDYIDRAINSVINQTFQNLEIIIIDNNSIDNTNLILAKYKSDPRFKIITLDNGGIIAKSRNAGIKLSSGNWIAFLDSDDWWHSLKLKSCLDFAKKYAVDLVYHDMYSVCKKGQRLFFKKENSKNIKYPKFFNLLKYGNAIVNSSVILRKQIIDQVGLLSEDRELIAWEDFDYWLRVSRFTEKISYHSEGLGYYWRGGKNISNPTKELETAEYIYKYYIEKECTSIPYWYYYTKSKSFYKEGIYENVITLLKSASFEGASIEFILKGMFLYFNSKRKVFIEKF